MAKKTETATVTSVGADPGRLAEYEKGLGLVYKGQWAAAEKVFRPLAESASGTFLTDRARQFLEVCKLHLDEDESVPEDAYVAAVAAKNDGDLETAREACIRGGLKGRDPRFAYLAAAIEALDGNLEEAEKQLRKAVELDPGSRVVAFWDPDFEALREDPELGAIFSVD